MIKSVQSSKSVNLPSVKNFKGTEAKENSKGIAVESQAQALETKYNLACLLAATTQIENEKLRQDLAVATALMNYRKACC